MRIARGATAPAPTITNAAKAVPRAILIHPTDQRTCPVTEGSAPVFGLVGFHGTPRALLVSGGADLPPAGGTTAARDTVGHVGGRVVSLTPRALARLMGLDDAYRLPARTSVACRILGNGVCPPVAAALEGQFLATLQERDQS